MDRKHIGLLGFLLTTLMLPSMLTLGRPLGSGVITYLLVGYSDDVRETYGSLGETLYDFALGFVGYGASWELAVTYGIAISCSVNAVVGFAAAF